MERKFARDPQLKVKYVEFMNEYRDLKHMSLVGPLKDHLLNKSQYFLPHHAVFKIDGDQSKIRVVFDGSAKSSTGISLNDTLHVGPKVQNDIFDIIIRFRTHKFVFTADIRKMYRQIAISPEDRCYQQILWRDNAQQPIQVYNLNTVTYGLSSAPYAAIKCLHILSDANFISYPEASTALKNDSYVDDILTGSDSIKAVTKLRDDLIQILSQGCFELAKWASNRSEILPKTVSSSETIKFEPKDSACKTLGLVWKTGDDYLKFNTNKEFPRKVTKRIILSTSAQIYDPLGLLGPIIVVAKILLQKLWSLNSCWDESVPPDIHTCWLDWVRDLPAINKLNIPRYIFPETHSFLEFHCFCDASEKAYGAAIYIRSGNPNDGPIRINLLTAKSKVAPLKNVTLPRLELCSALVGARLMAMVTSALPHYEKCKKFFWSDSTIALAWISLQSSTLKTFVANRVAEIQELTKNSQWHHVPSADNPADLLSRGIPPGNLINNNLWWHGPSFLLYDHNFWPNQSNIKEIQTIPEQKKNCLISVEIKEWELLTKFSNFTKLQRSVAWFCRLCYNFRVTKHQRTCQNKSATCNELHQNKIRGPLTSQELQNALLIIIKNIQKSAFHSEFQALKHNDTVSKQSKIYSLHPFISKDGLIRVGGRLSNNSLISETRKHPYVLPKDHHVTQLIIRHFHVKHLHAGPQATLAAIREKFWIISGGSAVRKITRNCSTCFRVKPIPIQQFMGDLPKHRVEPGRVFSNVGLDYCGPIEINLNCGRGKPRIIKSYIAVFVCMSTKAVHLELVLDCSSENFLNALKRFTSRRGKPRNVFSDNAKNFVGANNELQKLINSENFKNKVVSHLTNDNIDFHFIPPRAPHFGGLWEAAVKSAKSHLKRVCLNALFNHEEMRTLLTQIEACLNSRPLTPLSNDPTDLNPLTPGHFLIGGPLTAIPDHDVSDVVTNRLTRWQRVCQAQQQFWKRWSREYLGQLQPRNKWRNPKVPPVEIGDLVILKEDSTPPLAWKMGRVTQLHPGKDGHVRVVTVKTTNGLFKRPVVKVCVLPKNN